MVAIGGGGGVGGFRTQPVLKIRLVASSRPENGFFLQAKHFQCDIVPATDDGEYIGVSPHFSGVCDI
jgi:hypothetical protein